MIAFIHRSFRVDRSDRCSQLAVWGCFFFDFLHAGKILRISNKKYKQRFTIVLWTMEFDRMSPWLITGGNFFFLKIKADQILNSYDRCTLDESLLAPVSYSTSSFSLRAFSSSKIFSFGSNQLIYRCNIRLTVKSPEKTCPVSLFSVFLEGK